MGLGEVSMNELVVPLAERLPMSPIQVAVSSASNVAVASHARAGCDLARRLRDVVAQVIVTVNPHEFHGVAAATGLDSQVDLIVTSADVRSTRRSCKPVRPGGGLASMRT